MKQEPIKAEMVEMTYREAVKQALRDAIKRDERVFLMGEDVGRYGGCYAVSHGLLAEFGPERIRDTPLSESGFTGAGIGAAMAGMRPIVELMTVNFSLLALDQILNTAATVRHMSGNQFGVPLVIRMATGAGRQLAAQHSHSLEGWYAHIPGIKVLAPATLEDARGMLWTALQDPDPVLIFENVMLYNMTGSFEISHASEISAQSGEATLIFILLFIGFGIKAGIIPFHKWLPYAHPASPSNISALMSGVMLKVAIYGLMRFVLFVFTPALSWGILIFSAGIISAILGIIYALKEHDIKRFLAYSSIENIGIILTGFGLYIIFSAYGLKEIAMLGLIGALFHSISHALFKSLLFMTAGSVVNATETLNIEEMGGLVKRMPYTSVLFLVGAVSISALPPFNGFISEFMIFQLLFMSSSLANPILEVILIVGLAVFALTSALAAACFVKAFGTAFLAVPRSEHAKKAHEVPSSMLFGSGILAALCIGLGVFSYQIFSMFGFAYLIPDLLFVSVLLMGVYALSLIAMYSFASNKERVTETWGCGILSQNSKMEYTASGFSEPIVTIFKSIYKTRKTNDRTFFDKYNSVFKEGNGEIHLFKFFEEYLYMPVALFARSVSVRVLKLQRGDVDSHIAFAFVAIVILLLVVGWFA